MLAFLSLFLTLGLAQAEFEVPRLTGPVVDNAAIVSAQDRAWLESALRSLHERGLAQVQVLTVRDLGGETIEQASIKVADKWKLGSERQDNGVLVLVALNDRQMRIEVGQGLEGVIPDVVANRIIRNVMTPLFKEGRYSEGIVEGVQRITEIITGESSGAAPSRQQGHHFGDQKSFPVFMFLFLLIISILRFRFRRYFRGSRGYSTWGSGWGGGGFGGGGGWGGGGGGFSGGGSSGRW